MRWKRYYRIRPRRGRGFSLIELMMVIAIVAVLASVAVPRYQTYVQRSHINASLAHSRALQLALAEYLSINAEFPPDTASLSRYQIPAGERQSSSDLVERIDYRGGSDPIITIRYGEEAHVPAPLRGETLVLGLSLNRNGLMDTRVHEDSTVPEHLRPRL